LEDGNPNGSIDSAAMSPFTPRVAAPRDKTSACYS
jgi:hypothetical protein